MQSQATTVERYMQELPPERSAAIRAVREVILANLDRDYEEGMSYGMIGFYVPHRVYPPGYHCDPSKPLPFAGLASQKHYMSVYLMSLYGPDSDEPWFRDAWSATGKRLDMGKCCVRFRRLDDVPLEVVGEAIRRMPVQRWIEYYETSLRTMNKVAAERAAVRKAAASRPAGRPAPAAAGKGPGSTKAAAAALKKAAAKKKASKPAARSVAGKSAKKTAKKPAPRR